MRGKLGLVPMGGAMFSKSLIHFSVDGWDSIPPYYVTWGPTMVEDNSDLLQKVPCMHCCPKCSRPCSRPPPTHASAGDSWTLSGKPGSAFCGVTALFSWILEHIRFVCALQESVSQSCLSSGGCMVLLMVTSSKRVYAIPRSAPPRVPAPVAVQYWPVPPQEMLRHSSGSFSVDSLGPGVHKVCLIPLSVSGVYAVWF